jgi:hypothetical protein
MFSTHYRIGPDARCCGELLAAAPGYSDSIRFTACSFGLKAKLGLQMTGSVVGHLKGIQGIATCQIRKDASTAIYVEGVTPPLPEGEYELSANGIIYRVQFIDGRWRRLDEN